MDFKVLVADLIVTLNFKTKKFCQQKIRVKFNIDSGTEILN